MKKFAISFVFVVAMAMIFVGCANLQYKYIEGDIKTYNATAKDLVDQYNKIENPIERKIKLNTVDTWGDRIDEGLRHEDMAGLRKDFKRVKIPE